MKIVRFQCIGGASGDMILGSLVGLGAPVDSIAEALERLTGDSVTTKARELVRGGLSGTLVTVTENEHSHAHRSFADIRNIINDSELPGNVASLSIACFRRLAQAEAKVHGTTPDEITFHEVGALDSIADIVGSCLALHLLGIDAVTIDGSLPLGTGTTSSAHGIIPVPAPATVEILEGRPVCQTNEPHELVTPTGATLLTTWSEEMPVPGRADRMSITSAAYGFGTRQLENRPNVLRAMLTESIAIAESDTCLVMECNLDDMSPELLGALTQRLLAAGALDVFTTPVQMKKQRQGVLLTVLATDDKRDSCLDLLFRESTTFGVREHACSRTVLARRHEEVETPYGTVRVKIGTWKGDDVTRAPEYEDCAGRAEENGVPVRTVYEAALRALP